MVQVTRAIYQCDICGTEIEVDVFHRLALKGHTWDLCGRCASKLIPSLMFLKTVMGDDLEYSTTLILNSEEGK